MAKDHGSHGGLTFRIVLLTISGMSAIMKDSSTTDSLKKLVKILKSRYSGERQADKYRAQLLIRRRKPNETLSDLHQDIRRLIALAYPKLTAQAPETQATVSAGEILSPSVRPMAGNLCWKCGLPGHLRRNCQRRNSSILGPFPSNNSINRCSQNMQDKANVYIKMKLLGEDVPCLMDTGCKVTLVPRELVKRFKGLEMKPAIRQDTQRSTVAFLLG